MDAPHRGAGAFPVGGSLTSTHGLASVEEHTIHEQSSRELPPSERSSIEAMFDNAIEELETSISSSPTRRFGDILGVIADQPLAQQIGETTCAITNVVSDIADAGVSTMHAAMGTNTEIPHHDFEDVQAYVHDLWFGNIPKLMADVASLKDRVTAIESPAGSPAGETGSRHVLISLCGGGRLAVSLSVSVCVCVSVAPRASRCVSLCLEGSQTWFAAPESIMTHTHPSSVSFLRCLLRALSLSADSFSSRGLSLRSNSIISISICSARRPFLLS